MTPGRQPLHPEATAAALRRCGTRWGLRLVEAQARLDAHQFEFASFLRAGLEELQHLRDTAVPALTGAHRLAQLRRDRVAVAELEGRLKVAEARIAELDRRADAGAARGRTLQAALTELASGAAHATAAITTAAPGAGAWRQ